jgi:hypothetical protein
MARKKSASTTTKRELREERRQQERRQSLIKYGALGLLGLIVVGALVWFGTRPATAMGEGVVVTSSQHVPAGTNPGPYQTDPPTGGKHYPATFEPGFYNDGDPETQYEYPEGYLVHNLEHGYVIFWYNCEAAPNGDCDALKATIQQVMDETRSRTHKTIAFPWAGMQEPLVMTSWDRILRFDTPDARQMATFVRLYYNKAPEPFAD